MSDKVHKLLTRLGNIWPKRIDEETLGEWLADWESALKQFDGWVIDAAATRIVHDRTSDKFPLPADVRRVCFQVVADDRQKQPRMDDAEKAQDPYKLASELILCSMGKRAAREGWALTLRDFIVRNGRLPDSEREISKLIATRDTFLRNVIDCMEGRGGVVGGSLAKLGQSMCKREYEIAQRILGPNAADWYLGKLTMREDAA
jgi:hypothetical protein